MLERQAGENRETHTPELAASSVSLLPRNAVALRG